MTRIMMCHSPGMSFALCVDDDDENDFPQPPIRLCEKQRCSRHHCSVGVSCACLQIYAQMMTRRMTYDSPRDAPRRKKFSLKARRSSILFTAAMLRKSSSGSLTAHSSCYQDSPFMALMAEIKSDKLPSGGGSLCGQMSPIFAMQADLKAETELSKGCRDDKPNGGASPSKALGVSRSGTLAVDLQSKVATRRDSGEHEAKQGWAGTSKCMDLSVEGQHPAVQNRDSEVKAGHAARGAGDQRGSDALEKAKAVGLIGDACKDGTGEAAVRQRKISLQKTVSLQETGTWVNDGARTAKKVGKESSPKAATCQPVGSPGTTGNDVTLKNVSFLGKHSESSTGRTGNDETLKSISFPAKNSESSPDSAGSAETLKNSAHKSLKFCFGVPGTAASTRDPMSFWRTPSFSSSDVPKKR